MGRAIWIGLAVVIAGSLALVYWAWDKTHLGPAGHERVKESIMGNINSAR